MLQQLAFQAARHFAACQIRGSAGWWHAICQCSHAACHLCQVWKPPTASLLLKSAAALAAEPPSLPPCSEEEMAAELEEIRGMWEMAAILDFVDLFK